MYPVELGRIRSTGTPGPLTVVSQGESGIALMVAVMVEWIVLVKFTVFVAVICGEGVITTEVAVLVFVVSRAGATIRLAETITAAVMMAATT